MFPFFESMAIVHGEVRNLHHHQKRICDTFKHFFPGFVPPSLKDLIPKTDRYSQVRVKWKFQYSSTHNHSQIQPYVPKSHSHFVLAISDMSYPFKSTRREELNSLKDGLPQGAEVIILKKGNLTDTTYSNLAFWDGTHWYTPSSPLLPGTMRAQLLEDGKMLECPITPRNLSKFSHFKCINAMNNLKEAPTYAIQCIQEHK